MKSSAKYLLFVAVLITTSRAHAATWYSSATGSATNGTSALPWSVPYAVGGTANPHLLPGDTVNFQPGTYVCILTNVPLLMAPIIEFKISGGTSQKITYQSVDPWQFAFDGGLLINTASNLILKTLRIYYSGSTVRAKSNSYTHPPGITEYTTGNELLHNLIENTGHPGIGSWKTTRGKYIAGNIIRFTGVNDYQDYAGAQRGSGMYLQNADNSAVALIAGNVSYFNYTTGMKAYGNTDIWGFTFTNQVCAENAEAGLFLHQDNYGSTNLVMRNNALWQNGVGLRLGYPLGNGGHSNAVVLDNYVVDYGYPLYQVDGWSNNTISNNVAIKTSDRYVWQFELTGEASGSISSHHIDNNTYWANNSGGFGANPFFIKEVGYSLANWRIQIAGDTNSTYTYGLPTDLVTRAFSPSTDTNFVHVSVFNWQTNATATVDLSSYFSAGALLSIYDTQNLPTAYTNITFGGTTVALDLTLTNRVAMIGTFADFGASQWDGFDSRFRAFVVHQTPAVATATINAVNVNVGTVTLAQ